MLSVGSILRSEREKRNLSLRQVEKQTHIRQKFLRAIESDDFQIFSSKIYIVGLIQNYSRFFDLDEKRMIAYFRRQYEKHEDVHFKRRVESKYFTSERKRMVIVFLSVIVLIFASFFGYQLLQFFTPPELTITQPVETTLRNEEIVTVVGQTEPDAEVIIYEERVFQNEDGVFEYDVPLAPGENVVPITVTGANGQVIEEQLILIRQEESS